VLVGTVKSKSISKSKSKSKSKPVSKPKTKKARVSESSRTEKPKLRTVTETLTKVGTPFMKRKKRVLAVKRTVTNEEREVAT
jgi:hypothetical protein